MTPNAYLSNGRSKVDVGIPGGSELKGRWLFFYHWVGIELD